MARRRPRGRVIVESDPVTGVLVDDALSPLATRLVASHWRLMRAVRARRRVRRASFTKRTSPRTPRRSDGRVAALADAACIKSDPVDEAVLAAIQDPQALQRVCSMLDEPTLRRACDAMAQELAVRGRAQAAAEPEPPSAAAEPEPPEHIQTDAERLDDLRQYLVRCGGRASMLDGWCAFSIFDHKYDRLRIFYRSGEGQSFASRPAVVRHFGLVPESRGRSMQGRTVRQVCIETKGRTCNSGGRQEEEDDDDDDDGDGGGVGRGGDGDDGEVRRDRSRERPVRQICFETGRELATYPSAAAASQVVGKSKCTICRYISGGRASPDGHRWEYVDEVGEEEEEEEEEEEKEDAEGCGGSHEALTRGPCDRFAWRRAASLRRIRQWLLRHAQSGAIEDRSG